MAVFNKNEELARQQVRIAPERAKGLKKIGMAATGFSDDGTRNTWGKISNYIPGMTAGQQLWGRAIAGKASKSDYAATMKAGDKDAANKLVQDVKLAVEVGKTVATAGAGGGGGISGGAGGAGGALGGGSDIASKAMGGSGEIPSMSTGGISGGISGEDALKQFQESGGNMENLEAFKDFDKGAKETKYKNTRDAVDGEVGDLLSKGSDMSKDNLQSSPTEGGKYDKAINTTEKIGELGGNVPVAGGIIEAGAGSVAAGIAYDSSIEEKSKEFQNKKKALSQDSLWM